jgi:DNA-binding NarL/FixJ family response regulator
MEVGVPFKILIVDDSPVIRRVIRSSIERNTDWQVCGEAENGKDAIQKVKDLAPNVVVLDLQMPVMNGLDAGREIARIAPNAILVMFTMHRSEELVRLAHAVGIREVVSKSASTPDHLISAMRVAMGSKALGVVA